MIEMKIKIGRQINKFLNSYAMWRNNAKLLLIVATLIWQYLVTDSINFGASKKGMH